MPKKAQTQEPAAPKTEEQENDQVVDMVSDIVENSRAHLEEAREEMMHRAAGPDPQDAGSDEEGEEAGAEDGEGEEAENTETDATGQNDDEGDEQDRLIEEAVAFGYSLREAKQFAASGALESMLARDARWLSQLQQQAPQQNANESDAESDDDKPLFEIPLDPDDVDPVVLEAFTNLNTQASKEIKNLRKQVEQISTVFQQQQLEEYRKRFEQNVSTLEKYEPLFGKGGREEITPKQFRNRGELLSTMSDLVASAQRSGRPIPSEEQLMLRAASILENELEAEKSTKSSVRKDVAEQMKRDQKGQFVAKPGGSRNGRGDTDPRVAKVAKILEHR